MNTVPEKPAADVRPGDHLIEGADDVTRVEHVLQHVDPEDGVPMIGVTVRPLTRSTSPILAWYRATDMLRLATEAEIAAVRERQRRIAVAEELRVLAERILVDELPMPLHRFAVGVCLPSRAEVDVWAASASIDVQVDGNRIPFARWETRLADHLVLEVQVQGPTAPVDDPEGYGYSRPAEDDVEPYDPHLPAEGEGRSLTGRTGNTGEQPIVVPRAVEHYYEGGSVGGPGENSAWCACGVTFDGFDFQAVARQLVKEHVADEANKTAAERDGTTSSADAVREGSSSGPVRAAAAPVAPLGVGATGVTPTRTPGYDPHPTMLLARGETPEQWYQTYARSLDSLVPHWYRDDTGRMAGELAAEAQYRLNVEAGQ